ncbi:MAG: UDP-N-acetylmuramoyl-tripeptide--D-alanyl-D-alanine ligase [Acidobacteria bacterium]|nr:UDP-N-acetylmuramoyl-tripeptide--D-alanyl-D-alanine ligase [Acidobacteriota bacterium]
MKLNDITNIIKGIAQLGNLAEEEPFNYSIDSRSVEEKGLFFAIKGEKFDGHDFVLSALEHGAIAAVISKPLPNLENFSQRLITVDDVLTALQTLASKVLERWGRPIIGITGSAGKTTTKELTALVLQAKGRVHKSVGNLNNAYGLPLSVLQMESKGKHASDFDFAVLEMGMSTPGEIKRLCQIAPPSLGTVLNVNAVHLEFFENLQGIANAKAELVEGLKPDGIAILNADDPLVLAMKEKHKGKTITFGIDNDADIRAFNIDARGIYGTYFTLATSKGETNTMLAFTGRHIVYNALAAAAVGDYFGLTPLEIGLQLQKAYPINHRGEVLVFREKFLVVDDTYNSNPRALDEVVKAISSMGYDKHILVAGEMLELGTSGVELHQNSGKNIAENKIDFLIGVRGLAKEIVNGAIKAGMPTKNTYFTEDIEQATDFLIDQLTNKKPQEKYLILIKGSRGVKLDLVVAQLREKFTEEKA